MRSVVVFDSQFGNTERIAQVVARALDEFGPARAAHIHETGFNQLHDVELLVFGCPIGSGNGASAMRFFVEHIPPEVLRRPKAACFDTRLRVPRWMGRFAAPQLAKTLRKLGVELVAPPEGFFVKDRQGPLQPGEAERAAEWARSIGLKAAGVPAELRPTPGTEAPGSN